MATTEVADYVGCDKVTRRVGKAIVQYKSVVDWKQESACGLGVGYVYYIHMNSKTEVNVIGIKLTEVHGSLRRNIAL